MQFDRLACVLFVWLSAMGGAAGAGAEPSQEELLGFLDGAGGRPTLIDFAASWCQPCRLSLPRLQELESRYPGIEFVVVSVDDEDTGRDELVESLGLTLPVVWDEGYRLAERLRPPAMPSTFLLDPAGKVIYRHQGYNPRAWDEMLLQLDKTVDSFE